MLDEYDWALDLSNGLNPDMPSWVPVKLEHDDVLWGFTMIAYAPPGEAVAVIIQHGQEHVEDMVNDPRMLHEIDEVMRRARQETH